MKSRGAKDQPTTEHLNSGEQPQEHGGEGCTGRQSAEKISCLRECNEFTGIANEHVQPTDGQLNTGARENSPDPNVEDQPTAGESHSQSNRTTQPSNTVSKTVDNSPNVEGQPTMEESHSQSNKTTQPSNSISKTVENSPNVEGQPTMEESHSQSNKTTQPSNSISKTVENSPIVEGQPTMEVSRSQSDRITQPNMSTTGKRKRRCGTCEGCKAQNCKQCSSCLHPSWKKACVKRRCTALRSITNI